MNDLDVLKKTVIIQIKRQKKKKDLQLFGTKLIEKNNNPSNSKEYYQSYLKKKRLLKG